MKEKNIIYILKQSVLFKDSFWAVFGNGLGQSLLLLAGIIIARFLGKDLYGEYGFARTTMFSIAGFSTFGLGYTSTKFVAEYIEKEKNKVGCIIKSSFRITLFSSISTCLLLFIFSEQLADLINAEQMVSVFRFFGIIIVCRALGVTSTGILAGYKLFKNLGINNVISGVIMVIVCVPLTYFFDIIGSLLSLLIAQIVLVSLNTYQVKKKCLITCSGLDYSVDKVLLKFSIPVAIQEFSYTVSSIGTSLLITKYASFGELGVFTACAQWNAVILFIPSLLSNVILSYLSSSAVLDIKQHDRMIGKMLLINFTCSLIPFIIVWLLSPIIVSFYGSTFVGMGKVLNTLIFSTIFVCVSEVFKSSFISEGRNWLLFIIRFIRDMVGLIGLYILLLKTDGVNASYYYAIFSLGMSIFFLLLIYISYKCVRKK